MLFYLIKFLIFLMFLAAGFGFWRTWQMEHDSHQEIFIKGTVPSPLPDGLYQGEVPGRKVSWLGKEFNSADSTGINVFDDANGIKGERYPFKTSVGKGSMDKNLDVLKIDYDIAGNPFWLRLILDEVVQVAPGQFLGKLQFRIIPNYPFTLLYFELRK